MLLFAWILFVIFTLLLLFSIAAGNENWWSWLFLLVVEAILVMYIFF